MKKIIFEEMGGTYIRQGDYLIPCLTLPEEEQRRLSMRAMVSSSKSFITL